jgi:cytochrome c oxidase subunit I+III
VRAGTPQSVIRLSDSTWIPLVTALTLVAVLGFFIAGLYLLAALSFVGTVVALWYWLSTTGDDDAPVCVDAGVSGGQPLVLPTQSASPDSPGAWGTMILLLVDGSLYASLVFAYFYLWLLAPAWPPPGHELPGLALPALGVALLLAASASVHSARRRNAAARPDGGRGALLLGAVLLVAFLVTQALMLVDYGRTPQSHAYASLVYVLIGYQGIHAIIALLMAAFVWRRSRRGLVDSVRQRDFRITTMFWHYTTGLWLVGLVLVHLFPRLT